MGDIGFNALILALVASVYSVIAYFIGARKNNPRLLKSARNALYAATGLMTTSVIVMWTGIFTHNYELVYVSNYSNSEMSFPYLVSALWAGNDGSLLFWGWLISVCAAVVASRKKGRGVELVPYVSFIVMIVLTFFIILLTSVANPFELNQFVPADGMGLNPMLENPGMIIHPPMLLVGYVVFTVPFAYAIAALITGKLGYDWISASRRWTILAWLFLGAGNVIGAWWAYVELGWGGYWAWDPVENAGLMPWLISTAFLHSVMIQRRAGTMKMWNMLLALTSFILVIFGTFITRSGVLASVHTYSEQNIGTFFVVFLVIILVASILLVFYRSRELKSKSETETAVSPQGTFLLVNILFVLATAIIFIGTVFPGIIKAISGTTISIGPSFFNQTDGPLFLLIILLIAFCTLIGWRSSNFSALMKKLIWPGIAALIVAVVFAVFMFQSVLAFFAFLLVTLVLFSVLYQWILQIRSRHATLGEGYGKSFISLFKNNKNRYGAYIVHLGLILLAIGVLGSSLFDVEKTQTVSNGGSMTIGDYTLVYNGLSESQSGYKSIVSADVTLLRDGKQIDELTPQKIYHSQYNQAVTEVDIHSTAIEDVYVALGRWNDDGSAVFQVSINPLVIWIWIGGFVLVLGGIICFWPYKESEKGSVVE